MKYLLVAYLIFLISCESEKEVPCIPNSLTKNTVAFYTFNNGSLSDKSGNDLHLVNPNKVKKTTDRLGNTDCAYVFDSSLEQYLSRNGRFLNDYHKNGFSISLWFQPKGARDNGNYELLLGRIATYDLKKVDKYGEWSIGLYDCRRAVFSINRKALWDDFHSIWKDDNAQNKCDLERIALTDVWHHLVVTFDGKVRKMYKNGKITIRVTNEFPGGSMSRNLGDFIIGYRFNGVLDDIIIFDKVLSPNEVNELYNLEPCCQ